MNKKKTSIMSKVKINHLTFLLIFSLFSVYSSTQAQAPAEDAASASGISTDPAVIAEGASLFKGNCTSCHQVHKKVIGPALANVWERVPSIEWVYSFVQNSTKVIASEDEYAVKIYNEYKKTQMTSFPSLDNSKIDAILAYIQDETINNAPVEEVVVAGGGGATATGGGVDSSYVTTVMVILVIVLVLILVVLGLMVNILTKVLKDKDDLEEADVEVVNQKSDLGKFFSSNGVVGIFIFIIVALGMKAGIDGLFTVGVQQNYQPNQPIAFSHQIHAGQYEIDCNYCHTGVRKAKSAKISV